MLDNEIPLDCNEQIVSDAGVAIPTGIGIILTGIVVVLEHCPGFGVNIYVVVAVALNEGDQVPETPFVESRGKLITDPKQTGAIVANEGVDVFGIGLITTDNDAEIQPFVVFFAVIE